jgi:hypothetical protein
LAGCRRLLDGARWSDVASASGGDCRLPETCITAIVVGIAAAFDDAP